MIRQKFFAASALILCAALAVSLSAARVPNGKAADPAKGKEAFEQCAICHNVDNDEKKMGPSLKGLFKRAKLQSGKKVTEENVREQINNGGNGMPAYAFPRPKLGRDEPTRTTLVVMRPDKGD